MREGPWAWGKTLGRVGCWESVGDAWVSAVGRLVAWCGGCFGLARASSSGEGNNIV